MKRQFKCIFLFFISACFLTSCEDKKLEYFSLNVVVSKEFSGKAGDPLPSGIRQFSSYYQNGNCVGTVYVPNVTFIRPDLEKEKSQELAPPLSALNNVRKSIGMLSAVNLMEDYDELVPNLKTPALLVEKSTKALTQNELQAKYPDIIFVALNSANTEIYENLKKQISEKLCQNAVSDGIMLAFVTSPKDTVPPVEEKPNTIAKEIEKKNEEILNESGTTKKKDAETTLVNYKDKAKTWYEKYQLVKTIISSGDHHEAFELLEEAARLAIKEDKANDLISLINQDVASDMSRDKADRTIWRLTTKDHEHHWIPVVMALTKNDASLLHTD